MELGQKYSSIETINEVYRAEMDRLRDKVGRERGQTARDKEGMRRHYENMAENLKLDHAKEMDKERREHESEMDKLNGIKINLKYVYSNCLLKKMSEMDKLNGIKTSF